MGILPLLLCPLVFPSRDLAHRLALISVTTSHPLLTLFLPFPHPPLPLIPPMVTSHTLFGTLELMPVWLISENRKRERKKGKGKLSLMGPLLVLAISTPSSFVSIK